jgi:hypothetical protein
MTTILPPGGGPWSLIGQQIGQSLNQNLPPIIQQRQQRERGYSAIDRLQKDLQGAGGDISKILPAIARAYTDNPNLERSGLAQYALQNAKASTIYGPNQQKTPPPPSNGNPPASGQTQPTPGTQFQKPPEVPPLIENANAPAGQARETGYNIQTPQDIDAKAKEDALRTGDPAQYERSLNQGNALNKIAIDYRDGLEKLALDNNVPRDQIQDFMEVGEQFNTRNPSQWLKNTQAAYEPIRNVLTKMERSFIPGIGSALIGENREEALKRLTPDVQDLVKMGREPQARNFLASNWLSPTEIEAQIKPLQKKQEAALSRVPKGFFPPEKPVTWKETANMLKGQLPEKYSNPFVSYETAVQKAPKEMQHMQNKLADFFLKNVDDNTSLLVLRDKLWDKHYHWQQVNSAIRQAQEQGLQLNPRQRAELTDIAQPPIQSLPNIFQDWKRFYQFHKGAK